MSAANWDRVKQLFQAALDRPPHERVAYLREVCGSDRALQAEVESLLARHGEASSFAVRPASELLGQLTVGADGRMFDSPGLVVHAGDQIGVYEIQSLLGAGGMGEVYRARDTDLGRDVAIKVLQPAFLADRARLARFEREARVLAALSHPNVGGILAIEHVAGGLALVLELVEGETLAQRMAAYTSGLPIAETLAIGRQIAAALETAHDKGIVHRDLKPANIKITTLAGWPPRCVRSRGRQAAVQPLAARSLAQPRRPVHVSS